ncbi:hypothetical protein LDENG_00244430 [Lucifuga dentata]|nr:hypothetical protein LDENG_00244430 [Lucifuga dentata]
MSLETRPDLSEIWRDMEELQVLADSTGEPGHAEGLKSKKSALADLLGVYTRGTVVQTLQEPAEIQRHAVAFYEALYQEEYAGNLRCCTSSSPSCQRCQQRQTKGWRLSFPYKTYSELYRASRVGKLQGSTGYQSTFTKSYSLK